jgi:hypothetical protein
VGGLEVAAAQEEETGGADIGAGRMERNNAAAKPRWSLRVEVTAALVALLLLLAWLFHGLFQVPREIASWLLYPSAALLLLSTLLEFMADKEHSALVRLEKFFRGYAGVACVLGLQLSWEWQADRAGTGHTIGFLLILLGAGLTWLRLFDEHWLTKGIMRLKQLRNR